VERRNHHSDRRQRDQHHEDQIVGDIMIRRSLRMPARLGRWNCPGIRRNTAHRKHTLSCQLTTNNSYPQTPAIRSPISTKCTNGALRTTKRIKFLVVLSAPFVHLVDSVASASAVKSNTATETGKSKPGPQSANTAPRFPYAPERASRAGFGSAGSTAG
jgi:hypothetical protein